MTLYVYDGPSDGPSDGSSDRVALLEFWASHQKFCCNCVVLFNGKEDNYWKYSIKLIADEYVCKLEYDRLLELGYKAFLM